MRTWARKSFAVGILAAGSILVSGGAAYAHEGVTTTGGASGSGVITGNVVQVPVTATVPIQVCNNNVAAGLIAVAVDALDAKACAQGDTGVVNDKDRESARQGRKLEADKGVTTTGGASGSGVAAGNVVQVPVTANVPVQLCNNNVAAGVIAVAVDALTQKACVQHDTGVVNDEGMGTGNGGMYKKGKAKKPTLIGQVGNMMGSVKDKNNINNSAARRHHHKPKANHGHYKKTEATDATGSLNQLDSVTGLLTTATDTLKLASVTPNMNLG